MDRTCKHSECQFEGRPQSIDQFGKDRTRPDGRHPYCRSCRSKMARSRPKTEERIAAQQSAQAKYRESNKGKAYAQRYYLQNKSDYRARERERAKRPDVKLKLAEKRREYAANNQLKECARKAVAYQIRKGRIIRPNACEWCGGEAAGVSLEAHHWKGYDPEFWLDVRFVHRECHLTCESASQDDWPV